MIWLSTTDYIIIFGYFILIIGLSALFRAERFSEMFGEARKPGWLILAASLLMIEWSPMNDMMSMGLIIDKGYSGIWILKSRFWLAGVPAILYATMWSRLKMQTDNELIRLRFSGKPGIALHIFRAIFLSIFVIPFFAAFLILALIKFFHVLHLPHIAEPRITVPLLVLLLVFKNSFRQKIRTDAVNALVCLSAPFIICFFLFREFGGAADLYKTLATQFSAQVQLIPDLQAATPGSTALTDFLVFIFVQWWSVYIVDNSDPNAQRHLQAKSQFAAFKTIFLPIIITSVMFFFVSTIWDCGILEYKNNLYGDMDKEALYLHVALKYLPDGFKAIVVIAILFSFVTTLESIINWGGALLTVDIVKQYLHKNGTDRQYRITAFLSMLLVASISVFFALNNESILDLQKFIFSISAGVAPVFMLRWFWWRINAWTQISAMLSSLIYTLLFDTMYAHSPLFKGCIDALCTQFAISVYALKIIILTALVVATWLTVMYRTQPDDKEHLRKFVACTGTGGIWPEDIRQTGYNLPKRIFLCLLFAATYILPYFIIWQFKFGSFITGVTLSCCCLLLLFYVYRSMAGLLQETPTP